MENWLILLEVLQIQAWVRIRIFMLFGLFVIPIPNLNPLHMDADPPVDPDPTFTRGKG